MGGAQHEEDEVDKLSADDLVTLHAEWERLRDDEEADGPQVECTSIGYVELWRDGDVVAFGQVIANVADEATR